MTDSITPPPGLVQQWYDEARDASLSTPKIEKMVATRAAQWGADQELEACCHLLTKQGFDVVDDLRAARRPKPPSLKEKALKDLASIEANCGHLTRPETLLQSKRAATIRRALDQLPDDY